MSCNNNRPLAKVNFTPLNPPDAGGRNLAPSPFRGGLGRGFSDLCKRSNQKGDLSEKESQTLSCLSENLISGEV